MHSVRFSAARVGAAAALLDCAGRVTLVRLGATSVVWRAPRALVARRGGPVAGVGAGAAGEQVLAAGAGAAPRDVAVSVDWWDEARVAVAYASGRVCVFAAAPWGDDDADDNYMSQGGEEECTDELSEPTAPFRETPVALSCAGDGSGAVALACDEYTSRLRASWTGHTHAVSVTEYFVFDEHFASAEAVKEQANAAAGAADSRVRVLRVAAIRRATPAELLRLKVAAREWAAALMIASSMHGMDADAVHAAQWADAPAVHAASLRHLHDISDSAWAVRAALARSCGRALPPGPIAALALGAPPPPASEDEARAAVEYALERARGMDATPLVAAARAASARLALYGAVREGEGGRAFEPGEWRAFARASVRGLLLDAAAAGRVPRLLVLLDGAAAADALPHRTDALAALPETLPVAACVRAIVCFRMRARARALDSRSGVGCARSYAHLLPCVRPGGEAAAAAGDDGESAFWVVDEGMGGARRRLGAVAITTARGAPEMGALRAAAAAESDPAALALWYCARARAIDARSGQLQNAVALLAAGAARVDSAPGSGGAGAGEGGGPAGELLGLRRTVEDLLAALGVGLHARTTLAAWEAMSPQGRLDALLRGVTPGDAEEAWRRRVSRMTSAEGPTGRAWSGHAAEWCIRRAGGGGGDALVEGLAIAAAVVRASKPTLPRSQRLIPEVGDLARVVIECAYAAPTIDTRLVELLSDMIQCLPVSAVMAGVAPDAVARVDALDRHLTVAEVLLRYNRVVPLHVMRDWAGAAGAADGRVASAGAAEAEYAAARDRAACPAHALLEALAREGVRVLIGGDDGGTWRRPRVWRGCGLLGADVACVTFAEVDDEYGDGSAMTSAWAQVARDVEAVREGCAQPRRMRVCALRGREVVRPRRCAKWVSRAFVERTLLESMLLASAVHPAREWIARSRGHAGDDDEVLFWTVASAAALMAAQVWARRSHELTACPGGILMGFVARARTLCAHCCAGAL